MPDLKSPIEAAMALSQNESTRLGLSFGKLKVTPGQHIPKGGKLPPLCQRFRDAKSAPALSFQGAATDTSYIVLGIDLDAPFTRWSFMGPILHWNQPGLAPTQTGDGTTSLIAPSDTPFIADYAGPGPPPGAGPHRYVFLLYEQPEGFDSSQFAPTGGKGMGIRPRMKFDLNTFVKAAGLGPVVACNYFLSN